MRVFLLAATMAMLSSAGQACTLTRNDLKGLALSPSHLAAPAFSTLAPAYQRSVCMTRAYLQTVDAQKGVIERIEPYSAKYQSPAEARRVSAAGDGLVERLIYKKNKKD